jgi:hypothetical protein
MAQRKGKLRSPENAVRVCQLIAEGYTLRQVAREVGCESAAAITEWVRADADFAVRYARAKEMQADRFAEEIIEIADDGRNDWMEREIDGRTVRVTDHEHIQRSRVRIDARKWLMAKMAPKKYSDRMTLAGDGDAPLQAVTRIELVPVEPKRID